jgi:hypothetical protein
VTLTRTAPPISRIAALARSHSATCAVFLASLVVRVILVPITHGPDFSVWNVDSFATLHGVNIYEHRPFTRSGPYAYSPLFLYLELPFQWLAQHGVAAFQTLGKVPIVAADLLLGLLLARLLARRGLADRWIALGTALFLLNPLVLYNGAFYGRFDSLGCALLLAAIAGHPRRASAWWFALAVAAKTFPVFVLPKFIMSGRAGAVRVLAALGTVFAVLLLPYRGSLRQCYQDIVLYDERKTPQGLSWQQIVLHHDGVHTARAFGLLYLVLFALAVFWLLRIPDLQLYCLLVLLLFILCSKVVLEQYLMWPIPLLILEAAGRPGVRRSASLALLGMLTAVGTLVNPYVHPFGAAPMPITIALALTILGYVVLAVVRTADGFGRTDRATRLIRPKPHQTAANAASRMSSPSVSSASPITSGGRKRSTLP